MEYENFIEIKTIPGEHKVQTRRALQFKIFYREGLIRSTSEENREEDIISDRDETHKNIPHKHPLNIRRLLGRDAHHATQKV